MNKQDIRYEIVKHVNTLNDLVHLCSSDKIFYVFCKSYKTHLYKQLIQKDQFKKSFFQKFEDYIERKNSAGIAALLDWYPIGKYYNNTSLNECQQEYISNLSQFIVLPHVFFKLISKLLFFPMDLYSSITHIDLALLYIYINQKQSFPKLLLHFFNIIAFHMTQLHPDVFKTFAKATIQQAVTDQTLNPRQSAFYIDLIDTMYKADKVYVQKRLLKAHQKTTTPFTEQLYTKFDLIST
jgi:hypothetical protein